MKIKAVRDIPDRFFNEKAGRPGSLPLQREDCVYCTCVKPARRVFV